MSTELPTTAVAFKRFMEYIWESAPINEYDQYQNALHTARLCGARRTGGSNIHGEPAHVFRFPGEPDYIAVKINYQGSGLTISYHGFSSKRRKEPAQ